jgi:hypothetical protein
LTVGARPVVEKKSNQIKPLVNQAFSVRFVDEKEYIKVNFL